MRRFQSCLQQAHFDWVTMAGMKELGIVVCQVRLCHSFEVDALCEAGTGCYGGASSVRHRLICGRPTSLGRLRPAWTSRAQ